MKAQVPLKHFSLWRLALSNRATIVHLSHITNIRKSKGLVPARFNVKYVDYLKTQILTNNTKDLINDIDCYNHTPLKYSHKIMNTPTSYIRAINDYTLSGHEAHFKIFDVLKTTCLLDMLKTPYNEIDSIHDIVDAFMSSLNYKSVNDCDVSMDFDSQADPAPHMVQQQRIVSYTLPNDATNGITLEYMGTSMNVSVSVLGTDKKLVAPIVKFIGDNRAKFKTYVEPVKQKTFYTISSSPNGYRLEDLEIKAPHLNDMVESNYNDDFQAAAMVVQNSVKEDKRGLILLHGSPGTGKTSYIKHLITGDSSRKIVYIPPHLASAIASPNFISFVKDELINAVLVIEDAEQVLLSREHQASQKEAVSNLLNLTDGILADALNLLIICTFNTDMDNLDTALLRKGRLLLNYKFDKLNVFKTNALTEKLYGKTLNSSLSLADIYNLEYDLIVPTKVESYKFGFA